MDFEHRLKYTRSWFWLTAMIVALAAIILPIFKTPYFKTEIRAMDKNQSVVTENTTRIYGKDIFETAVAITQTIYPATFEDTKPGAVVLVPPDDWRLALMSLELTHFPVDAPILFIEKDRIPEVTFKEIKRLGPEGILQDNNVKVFLVGNVDRAVPKQLEKMNLKTRHFKTSDPLEFSRLVDDYRGTMRADHVDQVMILPVDKPEYAVIAATWVAHMGHAMLFVEKDSIPEETIDSLAKRPQDAFIYVLAPPDVISAEVEQKLSKYGHVQRIPGTDPFEMAAGFAGYRDFGRNFGWWVRRTPRNFGWGISEAGHNFTLVNVETPAYAIPGAVFSHRSRHGPMLWVTKDNVPEAIKRYLEIVRPTYTGSQEQVFNYGIMIGSPEVISTEVQNQLNTLLGVKYGG